jgi:CheY-like chemotaxis protein
MTKLNLLVIDDSPWNQASARLTLKDHQVTVVGSIRTAYELFQYKELRYDGVLTDLYLPVGDYEGAMYSARKIAWNAIKVPEGFIEETNRVAAQQIPAGLVFALTAVKAGVPTVICTDTDHHRDWICSLLDLVNWVQPSPGKGGRMVKFVEARSAHLNAWWDEANQIIVPYEGTELKEKEYFARQWDGRFIKDWAKAMQESYLFPQLKEE